MHVCYVDESGTPEIPANTSHFVLAGISIPIWRWRSADGDISTVLDKYGLKGKEFHTAWILRNYLEQSRIPNFEKMSRYDRRVAAEKQRNLHLLKLQKNANTKMYRQVKKNYAHTVAYIHLTKSERIALTREIADCVSGWGYARLFAEGVDKVYFASTVSGTTVDEQAFEQVVSRFEQFLANSEKRPHGKPLVKNYGIIVHDNNTTVDLKHTRLMRGFHQKGTLWTKITRIVDTPLFVNSSLTSMVQIADLCAYSLRRYLENGETDLFKRVFTRADKIHTTVVGVRHFADLACNCEICQAHRKKPTPGTAVK
jgi:Protein of unknown function (DUF3800)